MRRKCRVIFYSVVGRYEPIFSRVFCRLFRTGCYIFTFVKDIHILKRLEAIASSLFMISNLYEVSCKEEGHPKCYYESAFCGYSKLCVGAFPALVNEEEYCSRNEYGCCEEHTAYE